MGKRSKESQDGETDLENDKWRKKMEKESK